MCQVNLANVDAPRGQFYEVPKAIELADELIDEPGIRDRDRAYAHRVRAIASGWSRESLTDIQKAIETDSWIPQNYTTLATYCELHNNLAEQQKAKQKAVSLGTAIADSDQAWLAATSRDETHRNGEEARRLADQACRVTGFKWWGALRSLAAAHAELGDFDKAADYARQAEQLAPEEEAGAISRQRRGYLKQQAWREE